MGIEGEGIDRDTIDENGFPRNYDEHVYTGSMLPATLFIVALIAILLTIMHFMGV